MGQSVATLVEPVCVQVKVVGQGDAMTSCDLKNFMLAVTVEGTPVNSINLARRIAPVICDGVASVANYKLTTLIVARQRDNQ